MSQWSEPINFSDSERDPSWVLTVLFLLASPEFEPATDASILEDMRVISRDYHRWMAGEPDPTMNLQRRLCEFVGQPVTAFADFMLSLKDVYAQIDLPLPSPNIANPYPLANAIHQRRLRRDADRWQTHAAQLSAASTPDRTAEQDAADFGIGFEVDGRRIAPERVRVVTPPTARS